VFKNSVILGCSNDVDLNDHRFRANTTFLSNWHGFACDDLRFLGGIEIEAPHPSRKHHPSSASAGIFV
jgi:hypothetical protein